MLALAAHLRGTGTFDPDDVRLQFAALQSFGVDAAQARRWLAERPTATREAICYAVFMRETNPGLVKRSWAHLLDERIRNQRTNGGVVGFADWAKRRVAGGGTPATWPAPYASPGVGTGASTPALTVRRRRASGGVPADGPPTTMRDEAQPPLLGREAPQGAPVVAEATAQARALWTQVCERASEGASMLVRSCLAAVSPVRVDGTDLLVVAPDGRGEYVIQGAPRGVLLQHLSDVSDGAVTALRLVRDAAPGASAGAD